MNQIVVNYEGEIPMPADYEHKILKKKKTKNDTTALNQWLNFHRKRVI